MNTTATIRLAFPATAEFLILARLTLAGISRSVPMSQEALADLKLAVTEACGNVVRHAYPAADGVVRVEFGVSPLEINVSVFDAGLGMPEQVLDPGQGEDLPESGMGLAIIRAVTDELSLAATDGGGTVVTMRKHLSGQ